MPARTVLGRQRQIAAKEATAATNGALTPDVDDFNLTRTLDDIAALLRHRQAQFQASADRVGDVLTSLGINGEAAAPPTVPVPGPTVAPKRRWTAAARKAASLRAKRAWRARKRA